MKKKEIQRKLYPNEISRDSHLIGAGEGTMAWITYWDGAFNIELLFLPPDEEDRKCS